MDPGFGGEHRERQTKKASGCGGQGDRDEDSSRRQKAFGSRACLHSSDSVEGLVSTVLLQETE